MPHTVAEIQFLEDNDQWFVSICVDGDEAKRWGPYANKVSCIAMAGEAAKEMQELVRFRDKCDSYRLHNFG